MAKTSKKKTKSTRGVIVQIFSDHIELLAQKNNDEALKIYEQRTGDPITQRMRQYLANVKSDLKRKGFLGNGTAAAATKPTAGDSLEILERTIDQCLVDARKINHDDDLHVVIEHLRAARNILVRSAVAG
jgi:hypothetical protein